MKISPDSRGRGHKVPAVNLWARGERLARLPFERLGKDLTPYSFLEIFPQDQHERLLVERLNALGVAVQRNTELVSFSEQHDGVVARLRGPGGLESDCAATYIAGCDGARSTVRASLATEFPGGTYHQIFYVADVDAAGPAVNGELHVDLDEADFLAVFPMAGQGRARLIGAVREDRATHADTLKFEDVSDRAISNLKVKVEKVNWFSTYHVHHRVAAHFREGRAFLLGDAAHIHSPAGGQGMNTGIGDAINLAWKFAMVLDGRAPERLLDSYEIERIGFARRLVATTDRAFGFVTAEGSTADYLRTRVAPLLLRGLTRFDAVREYIFRAVSQTAINYRAGPLSQGAAGLVHGGDRLPWVSIDGVDNFDSLKTIGWRVHVYGKASSNVSAWCAAQQIPVHAFDWSPAHAKAGLARDAIYLLRPDTYVALADGSGDPEALDRYFSARGLVSRK
jgi:2-polyprenyl-6-methoxyphenol hydroxylase-like FAD-dependent oxidoreductase